MWRAATAGSTRPTFRASVDAPLTDKVLTKMSLFRVKDDGYATQVSTGRKFNVQDSWGLRLATRLLPTDAVTVDLTAEYMDDQNTNFLNVIGPNGDRIVTNKLLQNTLVPFLTGGKGALSPDNRARTTSLAANVAWDLGPATLTSITGYRITFQDFLIDSGGELPRRSTITGFNPLINVGEHKQYSQEFKLDGAAMDGRLTYVAGLFYLREENVTDFANLATNLVTGVQAVTADRTLRNDLTTYAAYTQADFKILPKLTLNRRGPLHL